MIPVDPSWLKEFDVAMKDLFAIDHVDAGMDDEELLRYADLPAREAALMFGNAYDLDSTRSYWL